MTDCNNNTPTSPAKSNPGTDPNIEIRAQYNKLTEDWRQLNTMLWAIPSVAVSIMAGIVIISYRPELEFAEGGWARFVSLAIGSLFLFALSSEVVKKAVYMTVISDRLKKLQEKLKLVDDILFPLDPPDVVELDKELLEKKKPTGMNFFLWLHHLTQHGREVLAWVIFLAAISVGGLAVLQLLHIGNIIPNHSPL